MRVLFLNAIDNVGGAARAAVRLLHGIREAGVSAQMMVQRKLSDDDMVLGPDPRFGNELAMMRLHLDSVPLRFYPQRNRFPFSPAFLPERLQCKIESQTPDIVHLHWLGQGFLRLETLGRIKRPLVWTLHDSWAFTGGCHIPFDCMRYREKCGACPTLGSDRESDLSRWTWKRKSRVFGGLDLHIVAPSHWLADCAGSSSLLKKFPIHVIPNGIDLEQFRPLDKLLARQMLRLPLHKKLILFGAMSSTSDKNKGFHLLQPALKKMASDGWNEHAELIVFGANEPAGAPDFGLATHYLGRLHDDISIALLYSAADLFIAPSMQENLPNTVMEAMACGTPCVAFKIGGMSDLIDDRQNGYLAQPFEPEDLAAGIVWGLTDKERMAAMSDRCRKKATKFSLGSIARSYVDLYETVINR